MIATRVFSLWLVGIWAVASVAFAQPASEQVSACIAASTDGQTQRDEGRLLAARAAFLSCAQESCPAIVRKSCAEWLLELAPRVPSVVVRVHDAQGRDVTNAAVTIDGTSTPLDGRPVALDPGTHMLQVHAQEGVVEQTFLLAEREQARLLSVDLPATSPTITPAPKPRELPAPPAPKFRVPAASWVLAGVGAAGVVTFAVVRARDVHYLHHLVATCSPGCSHNASERGKRKALAADISLGVGVAAFAGAALWTLRSWLLQRPAREQAFMVLPTSGGALAAYGTRY